MGCAYESLCWSEPQQVNRFGARGGATWAEPICRADEQWTHCSSVVVISSWRSSFNWPPQTPRHGDTWTLVGERTSGGLAACGVGVCLRPGLLRFHFHSGDPAMRSLKETGFAETSGKSIHAPLRIPVCFWQHKALLQGAPHMQIGMGGGYISIFFGWGFGALLCNETIGNYQVDYWYTIRQYGWSK